MFQLTFLALITFNVAKTVNSGSITSGSDKLDFVFEELENLKIRVDSLEKENEFLRKSKKYQKSQSSPQPFYWESSIDSLEYEVIDGLSIFCNEFGRLI